MERERRLREAEFQELKELVRPGGSDFVGGSNDRINSRKKIFDGTAPWAREQLQGGLHSYLTNPVDRWFHLGVANVPFNLLDFEAKEWLESVTDEVYAHYSNPFSNLNQSLHEVYGDLTTFGTGVLYQYFDPATKCIQFNSYPLADCWLRDDSKGNLNRLHRQIKWRVAQVRSEFGFLPEKLSKYKDDDMVTIIHAVFERKEYDPNSRRPERRKFVSANFCKETEELLNESGYDWMPYHTPRWTHVPGTAYGDGPALSVLPEIRMVNAMSKTMIIAAQKLVDPPLVVPDDGFLLPVKSMPGGITMRRPGDQQIELLPGPQRMDISIDMIEQRREMIRRGFYVDWLIRPTKKERQTAQEIMDDRNQMLGMMGPMVGRIQSDMLGKMIQLSVNLLFRARQIASPPSQLEGQRMDPVYISPAAKAQSTVRGQGIQAYVQQITQLLPVLPNLIDSINEDGLNAELQDLSDTPRSVINSPEAIARKRQAREQQQQLAAAAQVAPQAAKAAKDFAQAQQLGGMMQ